MSTKYRSKRPGNNAFILFPLLSSCFTSLQCALCYSTTHHAFGTSVNRNTIDMPFAVPMRRTVLQLIKQPQQHLENSRRRSTISGYRYAKDFCNHLRRGWFHGFRSGLSDSNQKPRDSRVISSCSHESEHEVAAARLILNDLVSIEQNPTIIRKATGVGKGLDEMETKAFKLLHIKDWETSSVTKSTNTSSASLYMSQQHLIHAADFLNTTFHITTVVQPEHERLEKTFVGSASNHTHAVLTTDEFVQLKTSLQETFDCVILDAFIDFEKRDHLQHIMEVASFVTKLGGLIAVRGPTSAEDSWALSELIHFLPLKLLSIEKAFNVEKDSHPLQGEVQTLAYSSFVRVPHCALKTLLRLRGPVASGYGRGGKKLGIPTANLPESLFANALVPLPAGVYFGWAVIEGDSNDDAKRGRNFPFKAVVNVGYSPTFVGEENREKIVEAHLLIDAVEIVGDFYNETMRLSLIGSLRPEKKFASFSDLLAAIQLDIRCAKGALQSPPFLDYQKDPFLSLANVNHWIGADGGDETASWEYETIENGTSARL